MAQHNAPVHHPDLTDARPPRGARHGLHWWPSALGLGFALVSGTGSGVSATLASVVAVIAVIYVLCAATGRQAQAWWAFVGSFPIVLSGRFTGVELMPFLLLAVASIILVGVGWARGAWAAPDNRVQLYGLVAFGGIALVAALSTHMVAAVLIAVGLLAHAVWDVVHHRRHKVVGRRYAEFCAVLDAGLAIVTVWGIL